MNDEEALLILVGGAAAVAVGLTLFTPKSDTTPVPTVDPSTSYSKQENPEIAPRLPLRAAGSQNPYPSILFDERATRQHQIITFMEMDGPTFVGGTEKLKLAYSELTGHVYMYSWPDRHLCVPSNPSNPWECEGPPPAWDNNMPGWMPTHFFIGPIFKGQRLLYVGPDYAQYTSRFPEDDYNRVIAVIGPDTSLANQGRAIVFQATDMKLTPLPQNGWLLKYGNGAEWTIFADGNAMRTTDGFGPGGITIGDPFKEEAPGYATTQGFGLGMSGRMTLE